MAIMYQCAIIMINGLLLGEITYIVNITFTFPEICPIFRDKILFNEIYGFRP